MAQTSRSASESHCSTRRDIPVSEHKAFTTKQTRLNLRLTVKRDFVVALDRSELLVRLLDLTA